MTARMRRLVSDWEQVRRDFADHKHIQVTPVGAEPYEKYHVTYFVNGIYLLADGRIETLARHEVDVTLHSDYPRYKPVCTIQTPIWHPNFRDGQICIGDIWGAGESLSDIIINIGHMIQYKSWNSFSPLCADAAQWAIENKHLFPVGNIDLYVAEDLSTATDSVEIDLFDEPAQAEPEAAAEVVAEAQPARPEPESANPAQPEAQAEPAPQPAPAEEGNDFDITAEELAGIEFIPTAQRMQSLSHGGTVKGKRLNFKTVLFKGILWALIGALVGFGLTEFTDDNLTGNATAAVLSGHSELQEYFQYSDQRDEVFDDIMDRFYDWCDANGQDPEAEDSFPLWMYSDSITSETEALFDRYNVYDAQANETLLEAAEQHYDYDPDRVGQAIDAVLRMSSAMWSGLLALFIGLFLGLGEGIFYGSGRKAALYALIGAGISVVTGFVSGYLAQWMYADLLSDSDGLFLQALIRGVGWAVMGLGIGLGAGLIKPQPKRILFCCLGGLGGGFVGGFLFDYICVLVPRDIVARGVGIVITGLLVGLLVGLMEQVAKQAWLKVIRGEFEGKEYLVFSGTTSIGNNARNTIVLFKDKLVGPHHCDVVLEGNSYVLYDRGTPMGTVVNGMRIKRHVLRRGDAIALGNSVLVFNTK